MKKILLTSLLLVLGIALLHAQSDPIKWGKIDKEDLEMTVYEPDPDAPAVVLADFGQAFFTYNDRKGFQLNLERTTRIKILTKKGLDYGDQSILLYHSGLYREEIMGLKGFTYNLVNGKMEKSKLETDQKFEEAYNDYYDIVKFTFPDVKEGSIIEFKYLLKSDFIYNLFTWEFQREIPVRWSEFRARVPEYFKYKAFMSGFLPAFVNEEDSYKDSFRYKGESLPQQGGAVEKYSGTMEPQGIKSRWVVKDAPGLKKEPFITTIRDYVSKIEFELNYTKFPWQPMKFYSSGWEKLNDDLVKNSRFGQELKKAKFLEKDVVQIIQDAKTDEEKIAGLVQYCKSNLHYNGKERVWVESSLKKVYENKTGNCAEINLLLTLMLREAGFQANPVILSTRPHGRVNPVIPLEQNFNYVIAHVRLGDDYVLLDATDPTLPLYTLPFHCLNQQGRLISPEYTTWVPLVNKDKPREIVAGDFKLQADGSLNGELKYKLNCYQAREAREKIKKEGQEKYLELVKGNHAGWQINAYQNQNFENINQELEEVYKLELNSAATPSANIIYLQPMIVGAQKENPFKLEKREFPVDFGHPMEEMYMYNIELPEGYVVEDVPEPAVFALPEEGGSFRYKISTFDGKISVMSILKIDKPVFVSTEYPYIKQFYDLVAAKQAEQVVLKKVQ